MKLISIIIATYNAGNTLTTCLNSIISQTNEKCEIIIIDGGSKDNTLEIIKEKHSHISYWISESDNGIYDAWNKGINIAQGKWIMFLGADDLLISGALDAYIQYIEKDGANFDIISSKLDYVDKNGTHLKYVGEPWNWEKFKMSRMSFAHPGLLHNALLFEKNGLYDTSFKICGDAEFFLRMQGNINAGYLDIITVKMQQGGVSHSAKAIIESYKIRKKNSTLPTSKNCYRFLRSLIYFYLSKLKYKLCPN